LNVLREDLGYFVPEPEIVNAKNFGVPQNRERIYIVGFHKSTGVNSFSYPEPLDKIVTFADIKEEKTVPTKYYLSTFFGKANLDTKSLIDKLEQVDREAICEAANSFKLQAIYFMEGAE